MSCKHTKRRQSFTCGLSGLFTTAVAKVRVLRAANKKDSRAERSARTSFDKGLDARGKNLKKSFYSSRLHAASQVQVNER